MFTTCKPNNSSEHCILTVCYKLVYTRDVHPHIHVNTKAATCIPQQQKGGNSKAMQPVQHNIHNSASCHDGVSGQWEVTTVNSLTEIVC